MKYLLGVALLALAATSCNTDNEGALYDPIAPNVSFETAKPAQVLTTETSMTVPVRLIRGDKRGTYTANYTAVANVDGIFTDDAGGTVTFADGEAVKVINVKASNMVQGKEYTYTMTLSDAVKQSVDTIVPNKKYQTVVSLFCDYNWIPAGTCQLTDATWYEEPVTGTCKIERGEGSDDYRIVSPLATLYTGLESNPDASHFNFHLNADKSISFPDGIYLNWWGYKMYYDTVEYPSYCFVAQEGNTYAVNFLLLNGTSLYTGGYFEFTWNDRP